MEVVPDFHFRGNPMTNFDSQVDIVYLWVDCNDKIWQKKRRRSFKSFLKTKNVYHGKIGHVIL